VLNFVAKQQSTVRNVSELKTRNSSKGEFIMSDNSVDKKVKEAATRLAAKLGCSKADALSLVQFAQSLQDSIDVLRTGGRNPKPEQMERLIEESCRNGKWLRPGQLRFVPPKGE
jgi:hypothetical protein